MKFAISIAALLIALATAAAPGLGRSPAFQAAGNRSVSGAGGGGGASCPADGSPSLASTGTGECCFAGNAANYYAGQVWNDGGTPRTICKAGFNLKAYGSAMASSTFHAYIMTFTGGNITSGSPLATSDAVTGSSGWNGGNVVFTFSTPFLTSASVNYVLCYSCGTVDSTGATSYQSGASSINGYYDTWNAAGSCQSTCSGTADMGISIYWQ